MTYQVEIRYSPVYELVHSLQAFADLPTRKILDLGAGWVRDTAKHLPAGFEEAAESFRSMGLPLEVVEHCPNGGDDPDAFIAWLRAMPVGQLYELVLTVAEDPAKLPPDLPGARDRVLNVLELWNERYFKHLDPRITEGLARSAAQSRGLIRGRPPELAVELITGGLVLDVGPEIEHVLLIPQYHCRPLNLISWGKGRCIISYPADVLPTAPGAVPSDLRNLTRALGDDGRLQILRFLAGGVRTFTDVVKFSGLAKSTVHHHMVILRTSGLINVHLRPDGADRYSFRPEAVDRLTPRLHAFLKEE